MSSTNSGPAQTQTQNMQPLAGTFNADGTPAAIVGPGGVVVTRPFDPSSVAITGGVIGGLGVGALVSGVAQIYGSIKVGGLGDSTMAGNLQSQEGVSVQVGNSYTYLPAAFGQERAGPVSWLTHLCLQSNGRLLLNHNGGVASDTSAGCLSRLDYEIAQGPQLMFLQMGITNDINGGVPVATSKANVISAVARVRAAGIMPVLVTVYPRSAAANNTLGRAWNEWLKFYGLTNNIPVQDNYAAVADPASTTGDWVAAYTSDGTHANCVGASIVAASALRQLVALGIVQSVPQGYAFSRLASNTLGAGVTSSANLLASPLFNLGATAGVAFGWAMGGTGGTASINTSPGAGILGSSQIISVAAGGQPSFSQDISNPVVGHRYAVAGLFRTTGCAAGGVTYSLADINTFSSPQKHTIAAQNLVGVDFANFTPFYVEVTPPPGSTLLRVSPFSLPIAAAGACTFEFAMHRLVDLDAL